MTFRFRVAQFAAMGLPVCLSFCAAEDAALSKPSAMVLSPDEQTAFVANEGNGTICLVSLNTGRIGLSIPVGQGLTDLVAVPNSDCLLAIDNVGRKLHLLDGVEELALSLRQTFDLKFAPLRIAVSRDATVVCVTSEWEHHVQLFRLETQADAVPNITPVANVELGFPQRDILPLADQKFLVAGRFGGRIAIVDASAKKVAIEHRLHGHNIRGMALEEDTQHILLSHQILSKVARSSFDDVHWGMLMQNVVRRIPVGDLLDPSTAINSAGRIYSLGDTGDGFADPYDVVPVNGGFAVLSAGTNKLKLMSCSDATSATTTVGVRPVRMAKATDHRLVVLNHLSNSVSVVDDSNWRNGELIQELAIGAEALMGTGIFDGERAFFDATLSHDGWMSCHSCHTDGHSPDLLADTLGDGAYGNPKRIPSLLGVGATGPWGWDGKKPDFQVQLKLTLNSTMQNESPPAEAIKHLATYLETLSLPAIESLSTEATKRGQALFQSLNCAECHAGDTYTSAKAVDVGLRDESGNREFNPPSLRGLKLRTRYFHDGRAASLDAVFEEFTHQLKQPLDKKQRDDLTSFLLTL